MLDAAFRGQLLALLVVSVAASRYALRLEHVREISRGCWPAPLVRPPFGCLGVINVRGELMPLADLGVLAGLRRPVRGDALAQRLLDAHVVVLAGERPLAVVVDRVLEVHEGDDPGATGALPLDPASLVGRGRARLFGKALARTEQGE